MKTFTLDEAQSLLPVLESLLKRALETRSLRKRWSPGCRIWRGASISQAGMRVNVDQVTKQRAEMDAHLERVRESITEIDAIGVQVKDLDEGASGFSVPPGRRGGAALLAHG